MYNKVSAIEKKLKWRENNERKKNLMMFRVKKKENFKDLLARVKDIWSQAGIKIRDVCILDVYRVGKKKADMC